MTTLLERAVRFVRYVSPPLESRSIDSFADHPGLTDQLLAVQGMSSSPWAPVGITDALAIPAVFRACTLISNLMGTFSLEAWRNGVRMDDPPRLVQRPDPFRTARDFWRSVGWNLATRGEADLYVGARDSDGLPLSLLNVPPAELVGRFEDPRDALINRISWDWRGTPVDSRSIVQIVFAQEPGSPRGLGPLQLCGAAISVARESLEWSANYYAGGGVPSVLLSPRVPISPAEAKVIRDAWMAGDANTPKVAAEVDATILPNNAQQAEIGNARLQSVGDVACMYGIPPELLEHGMTGGGTSLSYRNLSDLGTDLIRFCLVPGYLEPTEQSISDLLSRSTIARFNVDELERADAETRMRIYQTAIAAGVYTPQDAQRAEGLIPGSPQYAPMPPNVALPEIPAAVAAW
jgi:HK97 family phage portal protein